MFVSSTWSRLRYRGWPLLVLLGSPSARGVVLTADLPVPGQNVNVELDVPEVLRWGESAAHATEATDFVGVLGDAVVVRGRVELPADGDEVVTIRVSGGLMTAEIAGVPSLGAGPWIELRSVELELYPTGI